MKEQIELIKKNCIKANPDILKIAFGCKVKHKTMHGQSVFTICRYKDKSTYYAYRDSMTYWAHTINVKDMNVLGRDIGLTDILHMLKYKKINIEKFTDIMMAITYSEINGDCFWNLLDDNLEHQSKKTINTIYKLIK